MTINNTARYYKIGSWTFILFGSGHLIGHFATPKTPEVLALTNDMEAFTIDILGSSSNLLLFNKGFSLAMGILLLSYGLMNLFALNHNANIHISNKLVLLLNLLTALICCILSIIHFFVVPIGLTAVAFVVFLFITWQQFTNTMQAV